MRMQFQTVGIYKRGQCARGENEGESYDTMSPHVIPRDGKHLTCQRTGNDHQTRQKCTVDVAPERHQQRYGPNGATAIAVVGRAPANRQHEEAETHEMRPGQPMSRSASG